MRTKPSVRFALITADLVTILRGLVNLERHVSVPVDGLVITSGSDSQHMVGSKHYTGQAVDLRSKTFTHDGKLAFMAALQHELGPRFTVLLEDEGFAHEHLHIQVAKGA